MHYSFEYIIEHNITWILETANKCVIHDANIKMWELRKISLSRQPQTKDDADTLNDEFSELMNALRNVIDSDKEKEFHSISDGELIMIE